MSVALIQNRKLKMPSFAFCILFYWMAKQICICAAAETDKKGKFVPKFRINGQMEKANFPLLRSMKAL